MKGAKYTCYFIEKHYYYGASREQIGRVYYNEEEALDAFKKVEAKREKGEKIFLIYREETVMENTDYKGYEGF